MLDMLGRLVVIALLGYGAVFLLLVAGQRHLLYLPGTERPSEQQLRGQGLRHWPSETHHRGFVNLERAGTAHREGTVIVFHGNAGAAHQRAFYARALGRRGFRVILAQYPGYGGRAGRPREAVLVEDALETLARAYQAYGEPLYLWGESLGAGVVAAAIRQTTIPVRGLVLFLPWDTLPDVAATHYGFFPVRRFVRDRYDSIDNLRHYDGRVAVLLAEDDEVIPIEHGQRLYASIPAQKKRWVFENATHNQMPLEADLPWWDEVLSFVSQEE